MWGSDSIVADFGKRLEMVQRNENTLLVIGREHAASPRSTRREVVRQLLAAMSSGAVWPWIVGAHPICQHLRNETILHEAEKLGGAGWKPVFLSAEQDKALVALAETILPGSARGEVNRFIDLLLSVDKPEHQHRFVEALAAFDAGAREQFAKNFTALDDSQRNRLLRDASREPVVGTSALYEHFHHLRVWCSGAYYSSEAGMRELGWTGDYVYEKAPGCEHPEGHP